MCAVTSSIYLTFTGVCFAFVNICQKKKKERREKIKNGIWFFFRAYMYNNKKKTNTKGKTKKQQTSTKTKTKQNENIKTRERRIHYTLSIKYSNKIFLDSKIQHLIQWEKFTPLSATKEQLSYQHWKSEKISCTFIASDDSDSYPFDNILLRIQEDTSIDIPWV